jgi:hypothetical protein
MKRIVFLTFIGGLALALTAWGAPRERHAKGAAKSKSASSAHVVSTRSSGHATKARTSQSVRPQGKTHSATHASRAGRGRAEVARSRSARKADRASATRASGRSGTTVKRERAFTGANSVRSNRAEAARINSARGTQASVRGSAARNLAVNQKRNLTFARNVALNRDRNVRIVNHWRNDRFRGGDYVAFYNYNRVWHDRNWWMSSYPRVVFVLGGWWY